MFKKTTFALLPIFLLFQALALAADVKLAWDPNTEPELKGYYVYYGTASGDYSQKQDAGNQTTYTVTGLTEGTTYYFAVTAYSDTVESDYSDEISYRVPVPVVTYTLTASAGANGAINPAGIITVNQGTSQTFTITPAANYHVADVTVDGNSVGAAATYTFSNINTNHTISVSFKMGPSPCDEVSLAWNPSTDPAVRGYKVRYGTAAGSYDGSVDTGSSASCSISGLANNQQYYLKITAYTENGESDYSGEFTYKTCAYKKLPPHAETPWDPLKISMAVSLERNRHLTFPSDFRVTLTVTQIQEYGYPKSSSVKNSEIGSISKWINGSPGPRTAAR